jgi:hypothetical protein
MWKFGLMMDANPRRAFSGGSRTERQNPSKKRKSSQRLSRSLYLLIVNDKNIRSRQYELPLLVNKECRFISGMHDTVTSDMTFSCRINASGQTILVKTFGTVPTGRCRHRSRRHKERREVPSRFARRVQMERQGILVFINIHYLGLLYVKSSQQTARSARQSE